MAAVFMSDTAGRLILFIPPSAATSQMKITWILEKNAAAVRAFLLILMARFSFKTALWRGTQI